MISINIAVQGPQKIAIDMTAAFIRQLIDVGFLVSTGEVVAAHRTDLIRGESLATRAFRELNQRASESLAIADETPSATAMPETESSVLDDATQ